MKRFRMIALAAALAAPGLAVPATGQAGARAEKRDGESQQAEGEKRGAQGKEAEAGGAQRGNAEKQAEQGGARAKEERGANTGTEQPAADPNRRLSREEGVDFLRRLQQEENLYRKHLARINRLAELAREANDEARGKEVADLMEQENARHERALAQLERHVGPENFRKGQQKLRDAAREKRAEQAAGQGNDKDKDKAKAQGDKPKENAERKNDAGSRGGGDGEQKGGGR